MRNCLDFWLFLAIAIVLVLGAGTHYLALHLPQLLA